MDDVKVLYLVEQIEHERGFGQRFEGFQCFFTEAEADAYIAEENAIEAKSNPSGIAPDTYWTHHKRGYYEISLARYRALKQANSPRLYIDSIGQLEAPTRQPRR